MHPRPFFSFPQKCNQNCIRNIKVRLIFCASALLSSFFGKASKICEYYLDLGTKNESIDPENGKVGLDKREGSNRMSLAHSSGYN